ncbi:ATP-dependent OLD family endonuclease [Neorhizobium galegae bv. officinalis]|uniref:ATP-dependent OLD family endonuclease n=1 Tax=Neorhizobium galegae bv. officinalis TaxID=323656 RepID=A0A0T7FAD4_NEOGA|nr:AAA family ATPase [Neorhizobium galegae]CDZ31893.1 ATP-dependent OLD family endonuclease [Neorhizobium galegae bv. officinalis]
MPLQIKRMRVTNFRSVADSGWIDIDHVTAFIGVNESGKTNLLLPLWKFNPARDGELHPNSDYPKRIFGDVRANPSAYRFITVEFDTGASSEKIAALTGTSGDKVNTVQVSRAYDGRYIVEFPDARVERSVRSEEVKAVLDTLAKDLQGITSLKTEDGQKVVYADRVALSLASVPEGQLNSLALDILIQELGETVPADFPKSSVLTPRVNQAVEQLEGLRERISRQELGERDDVREVVLKQLPKFVYYSNYGNLDSEIYLPHVVENLRRTDLGSKEEAKARTLRVLFKFVQLEPQEVLDLGKEADASVRGTRPSDEEIAEVAEKKRERSILLQSAGTKLTTKFKDWWKQGDYRFRFEADGNHFRIWVADERRPEEIELESRSTGLQWFLSFYLVFLVESEEEHQNAVLLLDEPGLSLHPLAQRDLSEFFDNLAKTNQIVYTTHSPFLVDADRLDRARKVYVAADGTTKATPDLREGGSDKSKNGASYAVHSALNLTIAESLMVGCKPIIIEGSSDQHYLTAMKILLIHAGKIAPARELVFPPSGGAKTARQIASMLTGRDDDLPIALLDDDKPGRQAAQDLRNSLYVESKEKVLSVRDFTGMEDSEVEDLIPRDVLVDAVDRTYRVNEPENEFANLVEVGPIVPQIQKWAAHQGIELENGWKVPLSRRVKQKLLSQGLGTVDEKRQETWVKLFEAFEK